MSLVVTLFELKNAEIRISIEARFQDESLIIDGYDIGKGVSDYWSDVDYEYTTTVDAHNIHHVYRLLSVPLGDKQALLLELKTRFNTNSCYSQIQQWLDDHKIPYEGFSWA